MRGSKKGFTLIELLVVIAILAILATVVVVVLNPAELLKQSRDSARVSDFAALNSALSLYLADVANPDLDTGNPGGLNGGTFTCGTGTSCTASGTSAMASTTCGVRITSTTVDGTGWVAVNFTTSTSGSPLAKLPIDPVNSASFFYAYSCSNTNLTYELNAKMESVKYGTTSATEVVTRDGGNNTQWYEIGNDPALDL